jgi:outer membrane receptor protein involved in Fe transport
MSRSRFRIAVLVALGLFAETATADAAITYSVTFVDPGSAHSASYAAIFARINNLTDEKYAEVFGFPALGRAAYGGFKVRF